MHRCGRSATQRHARDQGGELVEKAVEEHDSSDDDEAIAHRHAEKDHAKKEEGPRELLVVVAPEKQRPGVMSQM